MRLQQQSNQQIITLDLTDILGHGGEARVYGVPTDATLVAKVYHNPTAAHVHKLMAMLANPPENPITSEGHISIAWPTDLLQTIDDQQQVVGFLMPRVKGMRSLLDFYNPKTRRQHCPLFNYRYLHRTARNLAAAVSALHLGGYCIGDVNESNILVSDTALITLVDTDSFQVTEPKSGKIYRCPVGKAEFTPPELQGQSFNQVDRVPEHDLFGLAVLIFQLLMEGTHPFSGVFEGAGDPPPYEARIADGHFAYSRQRSVPYLPTPLAPPFEVLDPTLRQLFVRCFEDGHTNSKMRPSAQSWYDALQEAELTLTTCATNSEHCYGNHLKTCPWCERTVALGGRDPFPSRLAVQQGKHLQLIQPKKPRTPVVGVGVRPTMILPTPQPLRVSHRVKTRRWLSPLLLSWISVLICGSLELFAILKHTYPAAEVSFQPSLPTPAESNSAWQSPPAKVSKSYIAYFNQGYDYYKVGDYRGAIENFNQALRLNPKYTQAYINLGNAYSEIAHHSGDPDKNYQLALENYNKALGLDAQQTEAYLKRGIVLYEAAQYSGNPEQEYQAALADFDKVLNFNPREAEAFVQRGIAFYKLAQYQGETYKDYQAAIANFDQAISIKPNNAEAYLKRGVVRYEIAQYGEDPKQDPKVVIGDFQVAARLFLAEGNMDKYQQALGNICVVLGKNCDSFLQNPESLSNSGVQTVKAEQK